MTERTSSDQTKPSLGSVYEAIAAVRTDVAVIKNELGDLVDHERRIRALEQRMWAAIGVFGLLAAASPYLATLIIT